jgi:hypothetical protein
VDSSDPVNQSIFLVDIENFSTRPQAVQALLHDRLYEVLSFALRKSRIDESACRHQDCGDGVLYLLPATVSTAVLLRELVRGLQDALAAHHASYREDHAMRLRVGLHHGAVNVNGNRLTSDAINDLSRLVDAGPVRRVLATAERAHMVLVVSEYVHQSVVVGRHPGIDPAAYLPFDFVTKHQEARRGWVTVPGYPSPPGLPEAQGGPGAGAEGGSPVPGGAPGAGGGAAAGGTAPLPSNPAVPDPAALNQGDGPGSGSVHISGDYVAGDHIRVAGDFTKQVADKIVTIHSTGPVTT